VALCSIGSRSPGGAIPNQCLFFFFFLNPRFGEILTKKNCEKISQIYTREIPKKNPISVLKNGKISPEKKMHRTQ
jgi:hypothetical protein